MTRRSERPTTPPAFDFARYARDSDARLTSARPISSAEAAVDRAEAEPEPRSETRLVRRAPDGATGDDEVWASGCVGAPCVVMTGRELRRLPLDHRAGFVLSLMDGTIDLDMLVEVCCLPRPEALRLVRDLFEAGVVAFR